MPRAPMLTLVRLVLAQCERECALGTIGGAPPQQKIKVSEA